jgi:hypothetical protein
MPKITTKRVYAVKGGSLKSFLNSVNNFLKKTKIVSTVGRALTPLVPGPYQGLAQSGVNLLASKGYGRRKIYKKCKPGVRYAGLGMINQEKKKVYRRRRHGMGALRLAGGAVRRTRMVKVHY